jgi:hypothetical protein
VNNVRICRALKKRFSAIRTESSLKKEAYKALKGKDEAQASKFQKTRRVPLKSYDPDCDEQKKEPNCGNQSKDSNFFPN